MEQTLAGLGKRVFLMNNVHEDAPVLFETRWTLSYLRGPLTKKQIQILMAPQKGAAASPAPPATGVPGAGARPPVPAGVKEAFVPRRGSAAPGERLVYRPSLWGAAKLHFVDAKAQVDAWADASLLAPISEGGDLWDGADDLGAKPELEAEPDAKGLFDALPTAASQAKSYGAWSKDLGEYLYRTKTLELRRCAALRLSAKAGESEGEFKIRVAQAAREARDAAVAALRQKYAAKLDTVTGREQRAEDRVAREQSQVQQQTIQTAISVGATVLGALFGRKAMSAGTLGRASTTARGVSRTMKEREDVGGANESLESVRARRAALEAELKTEVERLTAANDPDRLPIETTAVRPRKSDVTIEGVSLVWVPYWVGDGGSARPAR
jgi:hypothetical protein